MNNKLVAIVAGFGFVITASMGGEILYAPSLSVNATNYSNEILVTNGLTLGGVRNTSWPAGFAGTIGTVSNAVASAGLLSVDATKTNGIAATAAHIVSTLGFTPANSNNVPSVPTGIVSNNVASSGLLSVDSTKTNGIAATAAHIVATLGFTPANSNNVPTVPTMIVSNNVASAGLLAVDSTKTNGVTATTAMAQATLGQVYQSTNATLTALSTNTTVGTGGILLNSAITGMVSNNVASAGLLSVDATKTNGIAATAAHIVATLGYTPANSNSIPAADNWVASGTTNSTLPGVASANQLTATNGLTVQGGSVSLPAASVANAALANSAITINGTSVSLGGTRTLTLASADYVNQGTTHTLLHGNAAGNPAFSAVDLASSDVTGTLPVGNLPGSGASTITDGAGIGAGGTFTVGSAYTVSATSATPQFTRMGLGVAANASAQLTAERDSLGTTAAPAIILTNTTPAANGAQQYSPSIYWTGGGWGTTGGSNQPVTFRAHVIPTQGTTPTCSLIFEAAINNGSFLSGMTYSSAGSLTVAQNITAGSGGIFAFSTRSSFKSLLDGSLTLMNNAGNGFTALRLGTDSSSTPTVVVIRPGDGSGTDKSGGPLEMDGGVATGTGTGGAVDIATGLTGEASASTTNALTSRYHAKAKHVALTHTTATAIETFSLAANKILGGEMVVTCYATNSTPHLQSLTSLVRFDAVAVSTTITATITQTDNTTAADSGTLTCTYTIVDNANNTFSIKANANSSLSSPTERAKLVVTALNGSAAITITDP